MTAPDVRAEAIRVLADQFGHGDPDGYLHTLLPHGEYEFFRAASATDVVDALIAAGVLPHTPTD